MERIFQKVAIVHHSYTVTSLVEDELLQYVKGKAEMIFYITHPVKNARDGLPLNTKVEVYEQGQLVKTIKSIKVFGPEVLFFIKDLLFTLGYFLLQKQRIDVFFGIDNLNSFAGILLRKLGRVRKVVYYVIDYVPKRFENRLLNSIYHWVDLYCVKNADQTWNLSDAMVTAREETGLSRQYRTKQITVPVGCHPVDPLVGETETGTKRVVFLGILNHEQGIDTFVETLPSLIRVVPEMRLVIIGSGPLDAQLRQRVQKLGLAYAVDFKGFVKENKDVDAMLRTCHVGIAPYEVTPTSFKHFTDPGKIKTYLGAGLPVVMTNISHVADMIDKRRAGIIVASNKDIAGAVVSIFFDKDRLVRMRQSATTLAREYDWASIFQRAFTMLFQEIV